MGSKSRIAKYIVPIIQQYIDDNNITEYYELFVGGANVIDKIHCNKKYGYDLNKYLIALLQYVQDDKLLYESVPKELYDKARSFYYMNLKNEQFKKDNIKDVPIFEDWEIGNIGFLASFNGRFFDGGYAKSGYEKTKNGLRFRNYYNEAKNNLLNQASNLKDIIFQVKDYRDNYDLHNCVIYCDPPYNNTKQFKNSLEFNYDEFWQVMREYSKNNIVFISELTAPNDFECIWEKEISRSIKVNDKSRTTEKLFKYIK